MRPLGELDLADELGRRPDDVALAHAGHRRLGGERRTSCARADGASQAAARSRPRRTRCRRSRPRGARRRDASASTSEPKSRSRRPLPFVHPQIKNSCRKVVFSLSQSRLRLPGSYLELAFFAITPSRPCFFAACMSAGPSSNVSESLTAALSGIEQVAQPLVPLGEGQVDQRLALDLEHVEDVEDERCAALLHGGEARAALLVQCADLAVQDAVRRAHRLGEAARDRAEPLGQVLVAPATELGLAAAHRDDRAVAVPLDLEEPAPAGRELLGERREHRGVPPAGLLARRLGALRVFVALAHQEPVLLVAVQLRRDERPDALEPVPVQPYRQPAVGLLLHAARRFPSPRSRPCRRRTRPAGISPSKVAYSSG